jgi:hypothetical protein
MPAPVDRFCLIAYLYNDWPGPEAHIARPFEFDAGVRLQLVSLGCKVCRSASPWEGYNVSF